eukprot:5511728-Pyramimonas_sp.AAC.1
MVWMLGAMVWMLGAMVSIAYLHLLLRYRRLPALLQTLPDQSGAVPLHIPEHIPRVGTNRRGLERIFQGLEPTTGAYRAYSRGWDQAQGPREHIPGVGTKHRGLESIFQGLEPSTGD